MQYPAVLVGLIENAYSELFRNADHLGDKLEYKASETTRTPMEMIRECATVPAFLTATIRAEALAPMDESTWESNTIDSLDAARAAWENSKADLFSALESFPAEKLSEMIVTPWRTFSWRDFIAYAYWNPMWHAGQLAYIQMIHGDTEMHF